MSHSLRVTSRCMPPADDAELGVELELLRLLPRYVANDRLTEADAICSDYGPDDAAWAEMSAHTRKSAEMTRRTR